MFQIKMRLLQIIVFNLPNRVSLVWKLLAQNYQNINTLCNFAPFEIVLMIGAFEVFVTLF